MGRLYFVRHGETFWNAKELVCGASDIALTPKGHAQAVQTGQAILDQGVHADEILHSPLIRAVETATHISEMTGIPMREEPRLREQNFGRYEGMHRDCIEFVESKKRFADNYEGGESLLKVAQRVYNLLDEIRAESDHKTYILVAHNGIARMVQSYFHDETNEEYASFGIGNAEVRCYDFADAK